MPSAGASGLDLSNSGEHRSSTPSNEPMFNFRSLATMINNEEGREGNTEHVENANTGLPAEEELKEPSPTGSPRIAPIGGTGGATTEGNRSRGDSGESSRSAPPPVYDPDGDRITPAPTAVVVHDVDSKEIGNINILDHARMHEATQ